MLYEIIKIATLKRKLIKEKDPQKIGKIGEELSTEYLRIKGYRIIARNMKTKFSEVDIVCEKNDTLFIFEVKTRKSCEYGEPEEAINKWKLYKLKKSGELLLKKYRKKWFKIFIISVKIKKRVKINLIEVQDEQ